VRNGIDNVSAEADLLFAMLASIDRVVILLDEIDELVRERANSPEALSRFLTTSMLPKLAAINKTKRVIFVVATNHIEQFDIAISRPGRFDIILQVMPPSAKEKLRKFSNLASALGLAVNQDSQRERQLSALTYDETRRLAKRLSQKSDDVRQCLSELEAEHIGCTLNSPVDRLKDVGFTWDDACKQQRDRIRIPNINHATLEEIS